MEFNFLFFLFLLFLFLFNLCYQLNLVVIYTLYPSSYARHPQQTGLETCHRCLVFMGDLARYHEQYSDSPDKSYALARATYEHVRRKMHKIVTA